MRAVSSTELAAVQQLSCSTPSWGLLLAFISITCAGTLARSTGRVVLHLVPLSIQPFHCLAAGWRAASAPQCWKCRVQSLMFLFLGFFWFVFFFWWCWVSYPEGISFDSTNNLLPILTLNASIQGPWRAVWRLRCLLCMGSTGRRVHPAECSTCVSTSCYYCR